MRHFCELFRNKSLNKSGNKYKSFLSSNRAKTAHNTACAVRLPFASHCLFAERRRQCFGKGSAHPSLTAVCPSGKIVPQSNFAQAGTLCAMAEPRITEILAAKIDVDGRFDILLIHSSQRIMRKLLTSSLALGLASCVTGRLDPRSGAEECINANIRYLAAAVRAVDTNSAICYQPADLLKNTGTAVKTACAPLIPVAEQRAEFESNVDSLVTRMAENCARLVDMQGVNKDK